MDSGEQISGGDGAGVVPLNLWEKTRLAQLAAASNMTIREYLVKVVETGLACDWRGAAARPDDWGEVPLPDGLNVEDIAEALRLLGEDSG